MGVDKRALLVDGEPMLRRVLSVVAGAVGDAVVVVAPDRPLPPGILDGLQARVVADRRDDSGPLAGIEAGLLAVTTDRVLVVGGDMPWLEVGFLRDLVGHASDADVVAAHGDRGPEPLLAVYRRLPALGVATGLLEEGERRARALLDVLSVETATHAGRSALSVNTPADLAAGLNR